MSVFEWIACLVGTAVGVGLGLLLLSLFVMLGVAAYRDLIK